MKNSQDLVEQLGKQARKYHLVAIYTFGSRSKEIMAGLAGEAVESQFPDSDVDIGVLPDRRHGLRVDERVALIMALEDLFEVNFYIRQMRMRRLSTSCMSWPMLVISPSGNWNAVRCC